ncbi:MAG: endonuclease/exonuclease/phosphatase family protein [Bacteroidales bacterium]|nr:endonuclease/exonuclease/phosphatase family protein [Bacteroidales bacterium]
MMKKNRILFFSIILLFAACDPFNNIIENDAPEDAVIEYTAENIKTPNSVDTLKIVTWNIKFGGGRIDFFFDCYGDRVLMTEDEVVANMQSLVEGIKQLNPDVIFLQEADVDSKRSAYVDQIQYILDNTDLNYGIYGSQWKSDFVPSDGIGRMNSGNAILSKYELTESERIPLSLIESDPAIVQYFYLRRNLLKSKITVSGKEIVLFGTHTSAYSTDGTKEKQLKEIKAEIEKTNTEGKSFILGGDFNSIPPNSVVFENFDDDKCGEGSQFESQSFKDELGIMNIFYDDYNPAIKMSRYEANNSHFFTFTSDKDGFWNRKLDYIFTNKYFLSNTGIVYMDINRGGINTMPLSDHAPVSVKYIINQ